MVAMFEDAFKQQPNNEELGCQTVFANIRALRWKTAQQVRMRSQRVRRARKHSQTESVNPRFLHRTSLFPLTCSLLALT